MALFVQKFGGTSVGTVERIQKVTKRIAQCVQQGHQVVVVVSAMGKETDRLVSLAQEISTNPSQRELDMLLATGEQVSIALLAMALQEEGTPAISLTGAQVGIVTENIHNHARILSIRTERIFQHLEQGQVVVVAGFQGVTQEPGTTASTLGLEVTTLGRGGSDTSAVALAAALKAQCCEIYTDVPGILTTDPRLVPCASLLSEVTSDEMLELASLGANVLHPRAVEIARNYGVPLVVRSSWSDKPGTQVVSPVLQVPRSLENMEIARPVDSVLVDRDQGKITLLKVPDRPGVAACLFSGMAKAGVTVDLIIQSVHHDQSNDLAFTVSRSVLPDAVEAARRLAAELGCNEVAFDSNISKVSITGVGMVGRAGIAAKMFTALAEAGINIQMISTSEIKVSCVVAAEDTDRAIQALIEVFGVELSSPVATLPREGLLTVRGVALDTQQARLAVLSVPDRPGMASRIFQRLAQAGVTVDMIIQSQRGTTTNDIAFTVPKSSLKTAQLILRQAATDLNCGTIKVAPQIAKVSIVGAGMEYSPGVAAKMFCALAEAEINIEMITTSEIKVSCVVSEAQGLLALKSVHDAFGLTGKIPVPIEQP
ncbi:MAG: aspartate kinase [Gloeobacterales cyanobacterium]